MSQTPTEQPQESAPPEGAGKTLRQVLSIPAPTWIGKKKNAVPSPAPPPGPLPGLDVVSVAHTAPPQVPVKDAAVFKAVEQAESDALLFHVRPSMAAKELGLTQLGGSILESLTLACHQPTPENVAAVKAKVAMLDFELTARWNF